MHGKEKAVWKAAFGLAVVIGLAISGTFGFANHRQNGFKGTVMEILPVERGDLNDGLANVISTVLSEDFEDGNYNGWTGKNAAVVNGAITSGEYFTKLYANSAWYNGSQNGTITTSVGDGAENYTFDVEMMFGDCLNATPRMLLSWWSSSSRIDDSYTWLQLDAAQDTVAIGKGIDMHIVQSAHVTISPYTPYSVNVRVVDGNILVLVNEIEALDVDVATPALDGFGAISYTPTGWFNGYVDNIIVTTNESTQDSTAGDLSVACSEDRYLPGGEVTITVSYTGANSTKAVMSVLQPNGTTLVTLAKIVAANGSATFTFTLPESAALGIYIVYAVTYDASAQTSFSVYAPSLKLVSLFATDAPRTSTLNVTVIMQNQYDAPKRFILAIQILDSEGVPLIPWITDVITLNQGASLSLSHSFALDSSFPTGVYSIQAQMLTDLPKDGGYTLDYIDTTAIVW
jgi:hypothetical protein